MKHKIVLIGGPGTGKSSVLRELEGKGYCCMHEVSREVTKKAQEEGIEQLFLKDPLLFSEKLLEGRENQFLKAEELDSPAVFFDRGIPTVHAYLNYTQSNYSSLFLEKSKKYRYTHVFRFLPWEEIYESDNERYEDFNQALELSEYIYDAYKELDYKIVNVPFGSIEDRCDFILNTIKICD